MVAVVMTTYNPEPRAPRFDYARACIGALQANLRAPEPIWIVVADDGSPSVDPILRIPDVRVVTGPHNGIGSSLNRALQWVEREPWMYVTDDWLLTDTFDLTLPLWLLGEGYDLVRLGPIHPNLMCNTRFTQGHGWWLDVVPTPNYAFATRPFLASPTLVEKVGLFQMGTDAYECERDYAERVSAQGSVRIAAINLVGPWEHIGDYEVGDRPVNG